jgi:cobalt-zinc-cadmium efflux system protein
VNHHHDREASGGDTTAIRAAFFLNLAFTVVELAGGLWTNSLAILADALHDFADSASLGLAWYMQRLSGRRRDPHYSYGYRRFSLLAALASTLTLIVGSLLVLSSAVPRLLRPEHSNAPGMIVFAVLGIVVNGLAVLRLRGATSLNAQTVAWHLLEDVLGWVAVLVVGVTLLFADLHVLDPVLSILITVYVLFNVVRNLRRTLSVFLQAVPEGIDLHRLEERIRSLPSVVGTHHTHVWSLDGIDHILTAHIVVPDAAAQEDIARVKQSIRALSEELHLGHTTLEVERESEDCHMKSSRLD